MEKQSRLPKPSSITPMRSAHAPNASPPSIGVRRRCGLCARRSRHCFSAYDEAGGFSRSPRPVTFLPPPITPLPRRRALDRPVQALAGIGEGGMGIVYMAEQQEPVRRKVALKIIKPARCRVLNSLSSATRMRSGAAVGIGAIGGLSDRRDGWPSARLITR